MKTSPLRPLTSSTLLARLIDAPDLVQTVRGLAPHMFSALVRHVGVEDAGEIIALATTGQLVAAFDEDLFVNARPGEREAFDSKRFVVWLEVLLEAGDDIAASRVADLPEDFVVHALSSIVLVLDRHALLARMSEGGDDAEAADKAIEGSLSEEIEGYLLISHNHDDAWDAALALILGLDRDHRAFLIRVLDRCAAVASGYVDDLEELVTVLSAADSLAEDVEAEREDRRSKQGYVEPRAARSFLSLARAPLASDAASVERDPITRGYFRDIEPVPSGVTPTVPTAPKPARLLRAIGDVVSAPLPALPPATGERLEFHQDVPLVTAMRLLGEREPQAFAERMEEFAYLANVLLTGAEKGESRFQPAEAAEAVFATVGLGAEIEALERMRAKHPATPDELCDVLAVCRADVLFRKASSTLVTRKITAGSAGFLTSRGELGAMIDQLLPRRNRKP